LIDVNGHDMHIWAEGTGGATVVFGVGYQMPSGYVDFYPLYNLQNMQEWLNMTGRDMGGVMLLTFQGILIR